MGRYMSIRRYNLFLILYPSGAVTTTPTLNMFEENDVFVYDLKRQQSFPTMTMTMPYPSIRLDDTPWRSPCTCPGLHSRNLGPLLHRLCLRSFNYALLPNLAYHKARESPYPFLHYSTRALA